MAAANIQDAVFDDLNYETWAPIAKKRLMENGVWDVVENGVSPDPTKIPELAATIKAEDLARWRNRVIKEMKALKILQSSLTESAFRKTISVASSKDLWDLLKKANEGEGKHIRRLDKQFEDLTMYDGEPMDFYLGRVVDLLDEFRLSGNEKGDDEVIVKLLTSLSWEYDDAIPVLKEFMDLPDMTLKDLLDVLDLFGDRPYCMPKMLKDFYISIKKAKSEQLWCGLCKKYDHKQEDCYYNPMARSSSGARQRNQQQAQAAAKDQMNREPVDLMLAVTVGGVTFDEDMWMIYTNTSNHMTPYAKLFTNLDRSYRGRVLLADGKVISAEGKGDVIVVMKGVKKTIKDVLFVPRINSNVLSVGQMTSGGYTVTMGAGGCTIKDETGKVFAETVWEERGIVLRLQVIDGNRLSS